MRHLKLFEGFKDLDFEEISQGVYEERTSKGYTFDVNVINKLNDILIDRGFKAYKSIEYAYDLGNKVRMVRNLKNEICMTYFPKQSKLMGKWFNRADKYHHRGVDYEAWNFDKKRIDTIEIKSVQTIRIKTDNDEWFYVELVKGAFDSVYYKCDQWKGLIDLLDYCNFIDKLIGI
jgi:hypothetical protein